VFPDFYFTGIIAIDDSRDRTLTPLISLRDVGPHAAERVQQVKRPGSAGAVTGAGPG